MRPLHPLLIAIATLAALVLGTLAGAPAALALLAPASPGLDIPHAAHRHPAKLRAFRALGKEPPPAPLPPAPQVAHVRAPGRPP